MLKVSKLERSGSPDEYQRLGHIGAVNLRNDLLWAPYSADGQARAEASTRVFSTCVRERPRMMNTHQFKPVGHKTLVAGCLALTVLGGCVAQTHIYDCYDP